MTLSKRIEKLCDRQDQLQQTYLRAYYSMDTGNPAIYCRYKGVSPKELANGEKYWGQPYPPSYRAFLVQQNGWLRFGNGWTLLGAPRAENKKQYQEIDKTFKQVPVVATEQEVTALKEKQKRDTRVILPTEHMALGTDFNYALLMFDRYRVSRSGEPEVVWVRYRIHVEHRWKNFEEFLKDMIVRTERGLSQVKWPIEAPTTTLVRLSKKANKTNRPEAKPKKTIRK
jgi:hypothetical protein